MQVGNKGRKSPKLRSVDPLKYLNTDSIRASGHISASCQERLENKETPMDGSIVSRGSPVTISRLAQKRGCNFTTFRPKSGGYVLSITAKASWKGKRFLKSLVIEECMIPISKNIQKHQEGLKKCLGSPWHVAILCHWRLFYPYRFCRSELTSHHSRKSYASIFGWVFPSWGTEQWVHLTIRCVIST